MKEVTNAYEEETGVSIEVVYTSGTELSKNLSKLMRGGNAPELFTADSAILGAFREEGNLVPTTDINKEINQDVGTLSGSLQVTADGDKWGVPWSFKPTTQVVRTDLLEEIGVDFPTTDPPHTVDWETNLEWARKIDESTDLKGFSLVAADTVKGVADITEQLWGNGVEIFSGSTGDLEVTLDKGKNRKRTIETMEYLKELYQYSPNTGNWSWTNVSDSYASETSASVFYSVGRIIQVVRNNNEDILDYIYPMEPARNRTRENGVSTTNFVQQFGFIKQSEHPDVAKDFVKWFLGTDFYIEFCNTVPYHLDPVIQEVYQSEKYQNNEIISKFPEFGDVVSAMLEEGRLQDMAASADNGGYNPLASKSYNNGTLGLLPAYVLTRDMEIEEAIDQTAQKLRDLQG